MESVSPANEKSKMVVDLRTPLENPEKYCQEITPDNPTQPQTKLAVKKVPLVSASQKASKRKLFGQPGDQALGNENDSVEKKKRSNDPVKFVSKDSTHASTTAKPALTERQQLAFLLEVTSTGMHNEKESEKTFTKVKSRKRMKRNGKCKSPRVHRRNERGETPLHIAAIKGDVANLKKLIKNGADVQLKDYAGWTALHEACNHGNFEAAKLLVKHGAAVNVPGFEGDTPLHDAVINNHVEVVDMLLSSGANPQQTNTKSKKPTDLISSQEMSDIFNSHGIQHVAFQKKEIKICSEELTVSRKKEKSSNTDHERLHVRGSILGNEIQRKETQGESKMEKPVMYICKLEPRNKEVTIRLTQVTPYKNYRSVEEDRRPESKETKPDEKQETPKEVLDVDKKNTDNPGHSLSEGATEVHDIKKTVLKATAVSFMDENCDQPGQESTLQSVSTTASETVIEVTQQKLVSSSDQDSASTNVKTPWCDPKKLNTQETEQSENEEVSINDDIAEAENQPVTCNESAEFIEPTKETEKQDSTGAEREENEKIKTESSLVPIASEKAIAVSQEDKDSSQVYVERSRTPEIDESIAVEVLSTSLLSGASHYCAPLSMGLQDGVATPPVDVYRDTSAACVYACGNQQRSVGYAGTSLGNATTSLHESFNERETNQQSSMPNDDLFLDVESFDPDMKESESEVQKFLLKKEQSLKQLKEQDNVISSTSNDNNEHTKRSSHAVPSSASGVEHTRITSWKFDNAISEKDYNRYYEKDTVSKNSEESVSKVTTEGNSIGKLRPWRLETKSRGRKSSRISGFNRGQNHQTKYCTIG